MAQLLSDGEIQERVSQIPGWSVQESHLQQTYKFKDFLEAIAFVNRLVAPAEAAGHHPDLEISYNRVKVVLTTHDAGGITEKDFALATEISQLV